MGISVETVKGYARLIMLKLRTRDRTEAAVWAAQGGCDDAVTTGPMKRAFRNARRGGEDRESICE